MDIETFRLGFIDGLAGLHFPGWIDSCNPNEYLNGKFAGHEMREKLGYVDEEIDKNGE